MVFGTTTVKINTQVIKEDEKNKIFLQRQRRVSKLRTEVRGKGMHDKNIIKCWNKSFCLDYLS